MPQELRHLTTQVEQINFPSNEPVDTLFTEFDNLATIAKLARNPMTEQQKINMGYLFQSSKLKCILPLSTSAQSEFDIFWDKGVHN